MYAIQNEEGWFLQWEVDGKGCSFKKDCSIHQRFDEQTAIKRAAQLQEKYGEPLKVVPAPVVTEDQAIALIRLYLERKFTASFLRRHLCPEDAEYFNLFDATLLWATRIFSGEEDCP